MMIGELATRLGVTAKALRLYEQRGLIPTAARAANGYRFYGEDAARQAHLVVGLRAMGLSLDEIAELLERSSRPGGSLRRTLLGFLDQRIGALSIQIGVLQGQLDDLEARYLGLADAAPDEAPHCICAALNRRCTCGTR
jgi:DNA-binding transcriptional MerR regulator